MIVDDDPAILRWCDALLSPLGHEVVLCLDPHKAIEILRHHQVDLLVIDVVMPGLSGLALLKTVRQFTNRSCIILNQKQERFFDGIR